MNDRSYILARCVHLEVRDHIGYLWLAKNEQNTLDADYLRQIIAAHDELEGNDDVWGVIWGSKSETCFSTGFDPAYMLGLNRSQKLDTFHLLFQATRRIYAFTKPELVLLPGHSFAAGSVLAAAADWRFMANDKVRMSFPEVMLGLSIPMAMLAMLRTHTGDKNLVTLVQTGDSFKPDECVELGIVNDIMPRADLVPTAEKYMRRLFQKPLAGFRAMKKNLRRPVLDLFAHDPSLDDFEDLMGANFEEALRAGAEGRRPKFQNP